MTSSSSDDELPSSPTRNNSIDRRVDALQTQLSTLTALMTELLFKTERQQQQNNQSPATPVTIANTSSSNVSQTPTNSRYTSEESGDTYDFLGVDDLLSTPRDSTSIKLSGFNALSGRDRMELSTPDKTKIWKESIRGLHPDKFKAITDLSSGLESLVSMDNIVRLDDMILRLQKYLASYGLLNVFYIIQFDANDRPIKVNSSSRCVLSDYHSLSLHEVEESVMYLLQYGREYHHENLKWSYDAILNSCTPDLRDILIGKMQTVSVECHTGPILFMIMMKQLTNVSPQAARLVINKIESLQMSSFEGESVTLANKTINAAHKWLSMIHKVPQDFELLVLSIYRSTSIPSFSRFLEAIKLHNMGFGQTMNHEELMAYASKFYEDAILEGTWDRSTNTSYNARKRDQTKRDPSKPSIYKAPAANEKDVKDIFGVTHKYCRVCNRWTFGTKAHITADHTAPKPPDNHSQESPTPTSTNENTHLPRNPEFRRVNFAGGL
jgi:hypothetical protein